MLRNMKREILNSALVQLEELKVQKQSRGAIQGTVE